MCDLALRTRRSSRRLSLIHRIHHSSEILSALAILAFGVSLSMSASGQDDVSRDLATIRVNRNLPGLSALVAKGGQVLAQGASGDRRVGSGTPLRVTDPINLGSCTKWMTATIAGRLVDRGTISWSTRVRDLFDNYQTFNAALQEVTLDQLLCHRGGVQQETTFDTNHWSQFMLQSGTNSIPQLRRWVSNAVLTDAPEVTPGTYLYANQGYAVAATMLELASGKDWETLIRDEIFTPLRMTTATLGQVFDNVLPPKAPVGHDLASGTTLVPRLRLPNNYEYHYRAAVAAAGYVACTLQDWAKFIHIQATSDIGTYLTYPTGLILQQPYSGAGTEGYGRGILSYHRSWALPGQALAHGGDIFGEDTQVWGAPALDFIVVIYANCSSANVNTGLALNDAATLLVLRYITSGATGPLLEEPVGLPLHRVDNKDVFDFLTLPGVPYAVETSSDLQSWSPANGASGQTATSLQTTFAAPHCGSRQFFRAKTVP